MRARVPVVRATHSEIYNCCISCISVLVSCDEGYPHTLSKLKLASKEEEHSQKSICWLSSVHRLRFHLKSDLPCISTCEGLSRVFAFVGLSLFDLAFTRPSEPLSAAAPVCLVLPPSLCPSMRVPDLACTGTFVFFPVFSSYHSPPFLFVSVCLPYFVCLLAYAFPQWLTGNLSFSLPACQLLSDSQ